ncbi:MAG: GAF domain-containing protein [Terriglobales bacterium]|jgi:GAF domain-containing protein
MDKPFISNLVRLACEGAKADGATLYLLDPSKRFLEPFVVYNLPQSYIDGIGKVEVGSQCCGRAVAFKKPWIVADMYTDPLFRDGLKGALESEIRAGFSVPVIDPNGEAIGSLGCHYKQPRTPSDYEIERNTIFATLIAHTLAWLAKPSGRVEVAIPSSTSLEKASKTRK